MLSHFGKKKITMGINDMVCLKIVSTTIIKATPPPPKYHPKHHQSKNKPLQSNHPALNPPNKPPSNKHSQIATKPKQLP
jgi:hypothetical protein